MDSGGLKENLISNNQNLNKELGKFLKKLEAEQNRKNERIVSFLIFTIYISIFILFILAGASSLNVFDSCKAIENNDELDTFKKITQAGLYGYITCFICMFISHIYSFLTDGEGVFCAISESLYSISYSILGLFMIFIFIGQCKAVSVVKNCNIQNADKDKLSNFLSDSSSVNRIFGITTYFFGILACLIVISLIGIMISPFIKKKK